MQTSKDELGGGVKQEGAVGADEAALAVNNGKRVWKIPKCAPPEEGFGSFITH